MSERTISMAPACKMTIGASAEIGIKSIEQLEWKATVNGGYVLKARMYDPYFTILKKAGVIGSFLQSARKEPTPVTFQLFWAGNPKSVAKRRVAFITDLDVFGPPAEGMFEFVAIDPPTWFLNAGDSSGKVYTGNVSDVITQVVKEYTGGQIKLEITKTDDNDKGKWGMMRQDPRTFIQSLLEWSSSLSRQKKTNWMTFSVDRKLVIKQQHDLKPELLACYTTSFGKGKNDVKDWNMLSSTYITALQNQVVTQGISTVSGKFIDKKTDPKNTVVKDLNTSEKVNVGIDQKRGFAKSDSEYSTSIVAIPEFSAGEIGMKYDEWIDGRARNMYLNMLPMVMAMRISVLGDHRFDDPTKLGVGYINLEWKDLDDENFFLSGKWLVNGFNHRMETDSWYTDLYLYRYDYNAKAQIV
tara:strand:+ start:17908 stop:19143 length:1236 start_codon:yes stop_codon:yes gene_type:complete